jgi:hypothetical protein
MLLKWLLDERRYLHFLYCPIRIKYAFHYQYMADDTYIRVSDATNRLMQPYVFAYIVASKF